MLLWGIANRVESSDCSGLLVSSSTSGDWSFDKSEMVRPCGKHFTRNELRWRKEVRFRVALAWDTFYKTAARN